MVELSRRWFLLGSAAIAAVASVPAVLPEVAPIYSGSIGEYNGIIVKSRQIGTTLTLDHLRRAKRMLAMQPDIPAVFHLIGRDGTVMMAHPHLSHDILRKHLLEA